MPLVAHRVPLAVACALALTLVAACRPVTITPGESAPAGDAGPKTSIPLPAGVPVADLVSKSDVILIAELLDAPGTPPLFDGYAEDGDEILVTIPTPEPGETALPPAFFGLPLYDQELDVREVLYDPAGVADSGPIYLRRVGAPVAVASGAYEEPHLYFLIDERGDRTLDEAYSMCSIMRVAGDRVVCATSGQAWPAATGTPAAEFLDAVREAAIAQSTEPMPYP